MTRQDLSNGPTTMIAEGTELVTERTFDAPRELVWAAMTSAEHIPQWWGPHGTTAAVVEMDVRPGGKWRWVAAATPDGGGAPFKGEYLEVVPPERLVRTSIFDVEPADSEPPVVEIITFEDLNGKTRMHYTARFPSEAVLSAALDAGMTKGVLEQYDRLTDLLTRMN